MPSSFVGMGLYVPIYGVKFFVTLGSETFLKAGSESRKRPKPATDIFNKFSISGGSRICDYYSVERQISLAHSLKSDSENHDEDFPLLIPRCDGRFSICEQISQKELLAMACSTCVISEEEVVKLDCYAVMQ
jgi:hypothetical protein